jgi:hypothetical protein
LSGAKPTQLYFADFPIRSDYEFLSAFRAFVSAVFRNFFLSFAGRAFYLNRFFVIPDKEKYNELPQNNKKTTERYDIAKSINYPSDPRSDIQIRASVIQPVGVNIRNSFGSAEPDQCAGNQHTKKKD